MYQLTKKFIYSLICVFIFLSSPFAETNDVFLSFQGYSGIINTPNARILPDGRFSFLFNNQTPPSLEKSSSGNFFKNYIVTIGMFPHVEITGRFMNASPSGPRDLSADFKCGYSFYKFNPWLPSIAGGIQDISGGCVFLATKYLVVSEELRALRLSVGWGAGPDRMKGIFWGAECFFSKYLQLLFDDDGDQKNAAIRLTTANNIRCSPINMAFMIKSVYREKNPLFTFSASLAYDLKKPNDPKTQLMRNHLRPIIVKSVDSGSGAGKIAGVDTGSTRDMLNYPEIISGKNPDAGNRLSCLELQNRLVAFGLENVSAYAISNRLFIRYENNRFGHNEMDALGIVLGAAAEAADTTIDTIHVTILRDKMAVAYVIAALKDYREFLLTGDANRVQLKTELGSWAEKKSYPASTSNGTISKVRCEISPRVRYFLGTEVGALDYQFSLNIDPFIDVWPGGRIAARAVLPLWNTINFDDDHAFSSNREKPNLNSAMLFQFLNFGYGITTLLSTGFFNTNYYSAGGDARFTDKSGHFKVGINAGYYTFSRYYKTTFLPYIGYKFPLDISLLAMYGTFWEQDEGVHVSITRSFDVTDLELFLKRTKNIYEHYDMFIGGQINIPLTLKKGMKPHFITITGKNDWHTSISTRIAEKGGLNYISTACGVIPEMLVSQDADFFNRNRLDNRYINDHKYLLRDTWFAFIQASD